VTILKFHYQVGTLLHQGTIGHFTPGRRMRAVGIQPHMQFQSTVVGRFNPELQWIVIGGWRFSLGTGQIIRPGFQAALVQGIGLRPYLEDNRVEMMRL